MELKRAGVCDRVTAPTTQHLQCMKGQGTMDVLPLQSSEVLRDEPPARHMAGRALHQESLSHA